jgi:hypothetical protein
MTAVAANPEPTPVATAAPALALVPAPATAPGPLVPAEVTAAEAHWWRGLLWGMAIGIPVCTLLWMGLVALAVGVFAVTSWPVWPAVGMAAVVGVFAGAFLGGWAGVTAGAEQLDEAELHTPRPGR